MNLGPDAERARRQVASVWRFRAYLLARLPLALAAGLRLEQLDAEACTVSLPGGWRTRNPFGSMYFAAQTMAAEMATGAPALVLVRDAPASVAFILRELRAAFVRRVQGRASFSFTDMAGMREAVARAAAAPEAQVYTATVTGRGPDGVEASSFEITWSFKRRER